MSLAARLALEWWRASGVRTLERLEALCGHYGAQYALPGSIVYQEALAHVRAHEVE